MLEAPLDGLSVCADLGDECLTPPRGPVDGGTLITVRSAGDARGGDRYRCRFDAPADGMAVAVEATLDRYDGATLRCFMPPVASARVAVVRLSPNA